MEIIIHQAILHVLDTTLDAPVLSGSCMEPTAEKTAYLQNHIEKLLASDDIRQCRPLPDSAFKNELEHNQDFVDLSCRIAGVLFDYMHAHTTIPGADLAVVDFTRDGAPWLGILKLNYKNGYTHYTETVEGAPVNSIIQQRACLPTQSGKVEEGALVNLQDYSMRLLEKKYDIDGHKEFYLSTVVFQYTQAEPEKKKLKAIQEAAAQAVMDAYQDEPHAEAQVAMLIANQAADNDNQVSIQQVRQQLEEEYPLAAVPFDDYVEKSDVLEAPEQPVTVTPARIRRMESRSIHTANGIEVNAKGIPEFRTNLENVFVGGDAMRGPATVVEGIADAARFAEEVIGAAHTYEIPAAAYITKADAIAKKGTLLMSKDACCEGKRCLQCHTVCENCVDSCPNRANVAIAMADGSHQIVHVDKMCNECGNCTQFCPYASEPCHDKFTLFQTAEDMVDSKNAGVLFLGGDMVRVRTFGEPKDYDLSKDNDLPADLEKLIVTLRDKYSYLFA